MIGPHIGRIPHATGHPDRLETRHCFCFVPEGFFSGVSSTA